MMLADVVKACIPNRLFQTIDLPCRLSQTQLALAFVCTEATHFSDGKFFEVCGIWRMPMIIRRALLAPLTATALLSLHAVHEP